MMHYLSSRFAQWRLACNDIAALRRLDDRLLCDMGIPRRVIDRRIARER